MVSVTRDYEGEVTGSPSERLNLEPSTSPRKPLFSHDVRIINPCVTENINNINNLQSMCQPCANSNMPRMA